MAKRLRVWDRLLLDRNLDYHSEEASGTNCRRSEKKWREIISMGKTFGGSPGPGVKEVEARNQKVVSSNPNAGY